jgi:photosystem II stability/assembly factor-like uncharacterized protein
MGGGFVTGFAFSRVEEGVIYTRTDIGGAYRYDRKSRTWTPLTDFFGFDQSNYLGIESMVADPVKADRVYMAVGMYSQDWAGTGAFMRSDDRGDTWKIFPVHFKMGGNELSRSNGERLAVDPHQPSVLYFGSRRNGLWRSEDEAETWKKVDGFPVADDTKNGLGLVFVVFDPTSGEKGKETPSIYVGSQVDGKIYVSQDAGKTWNEVPNQPKTGFLPRRAAFDVEGTLYVSYALGESPYALRDGAIYRYQPKTKNWTDITPLRPSDGDTFGYSGLAVDPAKAGTLVTATMDRWTKGAEFFRTTDGGKTWRALREGAKIDGGEAKHAYHHKETIELPQWTGAFDIDPFDSSHAMVVSGGGVWATEDLEAADAGKPTHWYFSSRNLEETAVRDIVSPPEGPLLLSAMGDICGFRHDKLDVSPPQGNFTNPTCASAEDIDFAELKPNVVARVGTYPWDDSRSPRGAVSTDGGTTWKQFDSEPEGSGGLGTIAVGADGATLVWSPRDGRMGYSRDGGKSWKMSEGFPKPTKYVDWASWYVRLASDRVNPKKFYAFHGLDGTVYQSEDGGASFSICSTKPRSVPDYEMHYTSLETVPGREGDLWITTKTELFRSTDSGKTFKQLGGVQEAFGVGFGKAAPGASFPAVYLSGKVGGVFGFFRSDDEADSFVRINDDQHQFGIAPIIAGDPRVYGRIYIAPGGRGILYGEPKK